MMASAAMGTNHNINNTNDNPDMNCTNFIIQNYTNVNNNNDNNNHHHHQQQQQQQTQQVQQVQRKPLKPAQKPRGRRKKIRTEPIRPICPQCEKQFSNQSALTKHKLTHSDERKFACQQCSKAFKRHDHLTGHMQTHSNRKPYNCTIQGCDKTYCDARSLRRHKENIHHIVTLRDGNNNNHKTIAANNSNIGDDSISSNQIIRIKQNSLSSTLSNSSTISSIGNNGYQQNPFNNTNLANDMNNNDLINNANGISQLQQQQDHHNTLSRSLSDNNNAQQTATIVQHQQQPNQINGVLNNATNNHLNQSHITINNITNLHQHQHLSHSSINLNNNSIASSQASIDQSCLPPASAPYTSTNFNSNDNLILGSQRWTTNQSDHMTTMNNHHHQSNPNHGHPLYSAHPRTSHLNCHYHNGHQHQAPFSADYATGHHHHQHFSFDFAPDQYNQEHQLHTSSTGSTHGQQESVNGPTALGPTSACSLTDLSGTHSSTTPSSATQHHNGGFLTPTTLHPLTPPFSGESFTNVETSNQHQATVASNNQSYQLITPGQNAQSSPVLVSVQQQQPSLYLRRIQRLHANNAIHQQQNEIRSTDNSNHQIQNHITNQDTSNTNHTHHHHHLSHSSTNLSNCTRSPPTAGERTLLQTTSAPYDSLQQTHIALANDNPVLGQRWPALNDQTMIDTHQQPLYTALPRTSHHNGHHHHHHHQAPYSADYATAQNHQHFSFDFTTDQYSNLQHSPTQHNGSNTTNGGSGPVQTHSTSACSLTDLSNVPPSASLINQQHHHHLQHQQNSGGFMTPTNTDPLTPPFSGDSYKHESQFAGGTYVTSADTQQVLTSGPTTTYVTCKM